MTTHTQASFIIPCNPAQAELALLALEHLQQGYTEFMELALWKSDNEPLSPEERIIRHCFYLHPEQDGTNTNQCLEWQFEAVRSTDCLCISNGDTIDTLHAAIFTQAVLKAFDMDVLIEIPAADISLAQCGQQAIGHEYVVTADRIEGHSCDDFFLAERKKHQSKSRYFVYRDHNTATYLADVSQSADFAPPPHFTEITPLEFSTMKKYLPVAEMRSEPAPE